MRGDGSQHLRPSDQPHLSLACILEDREQQVCPLRVSTCVFCIWRDEAARMECGPATVSLFSCTLSSRTGRAAGLLPT